MPNRLFTALLFAAAPFVAMASPVNAAQVAGDTEVVAVCASPEGLGRYFRGDIVSSDSVRPANADVEQHLSLVRQGDDYDLLYSADGVVRSVRAAGATIQTVVAEGGAIHHLMVEQDGYLDHFVFQSAADTSAEGKVVWATQRIMRDQSSTLSTAPCDGR